MKLKFSSFVLMLISTFTVLHAQISSRAIKPEELSKLVKYYQDTPIDYFKLPFVDVEKLKEEDETMQNKVEYLRYGKVVDVDLGFKQGKRTICQGGHKWYWAVTSKDALSLDFAFDKFFLPEGAELHIYNARKTMIRR
jgi:lysyl endopeptidase